VSTLEVIRALVNEVQFIGVEEFGGAVYVDTAPNVEVFPEPRNGRTVARFGIGKDGLYSAFHWLQDHIAQGDEWAGGAFSPKAMNEILERV
jgi:hypothetical protein